jgi:hypothetical protein
MVTCGIYRLDVLVRLKLRYMNTEQRLIMNETNAVFVSVMICESRLKPIVMHLI